MAGIFPRVCSFRTTSSLTSSTMKKYNDDKEKSDKKNGKKLARASQNSPVYSNPLCPFFPKSVFSFICHFTFPRYKNHFVSLQEKKESKRMNEKSGAFTKRAHRESARIAKCSFLLLLLYSCASEERRKRAQETSLDFLSLIRYKNLRTSFVFSSSFLQPKGMVKE